MSKFKEKASEIDRKIYAVYLAIRRRDTPLYAKLACGMFVWYALSPLDFIPDFVPVLGTVDDIVFLPFLLWLSVRLIPEDIMAECEIAAREERPASVAGKLHYAAPVIIIWALVCVWLIKTMIKYTPMPL